MARKYRYTLGIDPSGAFRDGKGTTGWCVLDNRTNTLLKVGTISANDYKTDIAYWQSHLDLIDSIHKRHKSLAISIEDYILYKVAAMSQVNSQLETVQLLGIIKMHCHNTDLEVFIRPAVAVKKRWSDEILLHKGVLEKYGAKFKVQGKKQFVCEHERDSIRHAMHFSTFENKE